MADIPPRPQPPECPDPHACCDSGCDPCIFDFYREELEDYRIALAEWEKTWGQASSESSS